jgi:hypothetical protein
MAISIDAPPDVADTLPGPRLHRQGGLAGSDGRRKEIRLAQRAVEAGAPSLGLIASAGVGGENGSTTLAGGRFARSASGSTRNAAEQAPDGARPVSRGGAVLIRFHRRGVCTSAAG